MDTASSTPTSIDTVSTPSPADAGAMPTIVTSTTTTPSKGSGGGLIGIILIVFLIIVAAFYTWGERLATQAPPEQSAEETL